MSDQRNNDEAPANVRWVRTLFRVRAADGYVGSLTADEQASGVDWNDDEWDGPFTQHEALVGFVVPPEANVEILATPASEPAAA